MATFSATYITPGQPAPGFSRTISVDDAVWADAVQAVKDGQTNGDALTEGDCINLMLREFVEAHLARAAAVAAKRAPTFQIIA